MATKRRDFVRWIFLLDRLERSERQAAKARVGAVLLVDREPDDLVGTVVAEIDVSDAREVGGAEQNDRLRVHAGSLLTIMVNSHNP